jgi:cyanophycinase
VQRDRFLTTVFCFSLLCLSAFGDVSIKGHDGTTTYKYFRVGSMSDVTTSTKPGFALIGGGKDLDAAFQWMCERSGGGDFLVIRATGTDAYNPYIQGLCHENSVATLVIPDRQAAMDPFVVQTIRNAEAIFISGGDQANYINFWAHTPTQNALNEAIQRGVPVGGTSAGLAVQGEYIYSAQNDLLKDHDLDSTMALANPFNRQIVIAHEFLHNPLLSGTITDTHFVTRDRMGRLLTFMARILDSTTRPIVRGIGIDEQTAVLVEPDGTAKVVGHGAAYFLQASPTRVRLAHKGPLIFTGTSVQRVAPGGTFDLHTWTGSSVSYRLDVISGIVHSSQSKGYIY